jgi:hypothetical protein
MKPFSPHLATSLTLALCFFLTVAHAEPVRREPVFKIERSKNANIIQYDAQIGPNGKLDASEPVVGYWIRLAEQGQRQELSWVQREFAFGFDAEYDPASDSVSMELAVDIGRSISVIRDGDNYRAISTIDGVAAFLDKVYINAHKNGFFFTVEYIDIFGTDVNTGEERVERFVP